MNTKGFSLVELMVAVAIAGALAAIAIPSYQKIMANSRAEIYANQLVSDLRYARSLAMLQNNPVTICQINAPNSTVCSNSANWQTGWFVLSSITGTATIVRNFQFTAALSAVTNEGITLSGVPGGQNYLIFNGNGMSSPVPSSYIFTIKPAGCSNGYLITIPAEGTITKTTTPCP